MTKLLLGLTLVFGAVSAAGRAGEAVDTMLASFAGGLAATAGLGGEPGFR